MAYFVKGPGGSAGPSLEKGAGGRAEDNYYALPNPVLRVNKRANTHTTEGEGVFLRIMELCFILRRMRSRGLAVLIAGGALGPATLW
jgi:hypothetical protein